MRPSLIACACALLATTRPTSRALGNPLEDPHLGGIGFSGPTSDDLSALYWNPAALGLGTGTRLMAVMGGQVGSRSIERAPIDPLTGQPGGSRGFAPLTGRADRWPTSPFGAGAFLATALTLGSRVTLAFGVYSPYTVRDRFSTAADGTQPARYHDVDTELTSVALAPGLSLRLGGGLRLGLAPTFLLSSGHVVFDQDTGAPSGSAGAARLCGAQPCGAENPAAAARYTMDADASLLDSSFAFMLGLGLHLDRPRWALGVSYLTGPLGDGIQLEAKASSITLPPRIGAGATLCSAGFDPCVSGAITFRLPRVLAGGFDFHVWKRLDVGVQLRWMDLSAHDAISVRAVGPAGGALRAAGLPEEIVLYRGLQDAFDLRLRALFRFGERVRLATTLRGETASAPRAALSPAVFGGALVEPSLAVRVRVGHFDLGAGYAFAFMPAVTVEGSRYDPEANGACEAVGGDLDDPACRKRQEGRARPTAAGKYQATTHSFALSISTQL